MTETPSPSTRPANSSLRAAIDRAGTEEDSARARRAIYGALLDGHVLVALGLPDPEADQPSGVVAGELHFLAIPRDDAEPTLLCFSDEDAFARWGLAETYGRGRLPDLWGFVFERGLRSVTINAGGPVAATLDGAELEALAEGRVPEDAEAGEEAAETRFVLHAPSLPVPESVAEVVADAAERQPAIRAAYVLEAEPLDGRRHLFAGLEMEPGATETGRDGALSAVASALAAASTGEHWLSATVLAPWELSLVDDAGVRPAFRRSGAA